MAIAAEPTRRIKGRFDAEYSDQDLLEVVAKIARFARPEDPTGITQRVFDANRAAAGEPRCPQANQITTRLSAGRVKRGWKDILVLACDETRDATQSLAPNASDADFDERYCYFALRRVHDHLVSTSRLALGTGMSEIVYGGGRDQLLDSERRKRVKSRALTDKLPTSGQILQRFPNWDAALSFAKLTTRAATAPAKAARAASWPAEKAAVEFVKANGFWPSTKTLEQFARKLELRISAIPKAEELREKTRVLLVEEGVRVPTSGAPRGRGVKVEIKLPKGGIPGAPRRADADWDHDKVIERLADWLESQPARANKTLAAYKASVTGNEYYPSQHAIQDHATSYTAAMKEATGLVRTRRRFRSSR